MIKICLEEESKDLESHVDGRSVASEPSKSSGWLHWHDGVDDCVNDAANSGSSEKVDGQECIRRCHDVEQCDGNEDKNVFHVVAVGTANSFNVWIIEFWLQSLEGRGVFGIDE